MPGLPLQTGDQGPGADPSGMLARFAASSALASLSRFSIALKSSSSRSSPRRAASMRSHSIMWTIPQAFVEHRLTSVPVRQLLIGVREAQNRHFIEHSARELHSYRQALTAETAGHCYRWVS